MLIDVGSALASTSCTKSKVIICGDSDSRAPNKLAFSPTLMQFPEKSNVMHATFTLFHSAPCAKSNDIICGDSNSRAPNEILYNPLLLQLLGKSNLTHVTFILYRYVLIMPANRRNRDPRVRTYNPVQDARIPTSNLTWERQAACLPGRVIRPSNAFKIPRTARQEPVTTLPNPPYEALNLTYATSRKSNTRPNTGHKRTAESEKSRGLEAKKAHLHWLHGRAIPDMDREIMKTNALVDNILAEQTELDTQMLAIWAMGGVEAYNNAYKAHEGLRQAISKRLLDPK